MAALFIFGLLMIGVATAAAVRTARERAAQVGIARIIVRWFTGHPWHGGHITDAGWRRPGVRPLTKTGHARKFWHRPGSHRMAIRTGETLAPLAVLWGLVYHRTATFAVLAAAAVTALAWGGWLLRRRWQRRRWRRSWLYPLHKTLAPMLSVPVAVTPQTWLKLEPDRSRATIELPAGFRSARDMERIEAAVSDVLALEAPDVEWDRSGAKPVVTFTRSATPRNVPLRDIRDAIEAAGPDVIVLGTGKRKQAVDVNLHDDSPHVALSMGSGGGKTRTGRFIGAQVLYQGGNVAILNYKMIGHNWARGLPNTAMAKTIDQIGELILWLDQERRRRELVADNAADDEDNVRANVGARILILFEEMNLTVPQLRKSCPEAVDALANLFFAGRQVRINILAIAQRLSAMTSGGGDARESVGCRIMGRYTVQAWKMLAGEHKMPEPADKPGRVQVVTSKVRECQVGNISAAEAKELALSGVVVPCPPAMPYRCLDPGVTRTPITTSPGMTPVMTPVSPGPGSPPAVEGISLRDVSALQIVPMGHQALKTARRRDSRFPAPVAWDSQTALYDPEDVAEWHRRKVRA